ncbi:hypothetical protein FNF27_04149 [Cafeteria roenbergensis]|uniref:Uncharacterized protein n=1 Tax=Cafeteria roenbergensis TaxID=33653 RepID=A0A5A8EC82_CAFRO|nr:hypothetical protein FNF31_04460 [Cafeteria roenbergensis]KAA0174357.1 hypothetical protein FNF27_04149 [Cafeteria roenbergensis]
MDDAEDPGAAKFDAASTASWAMVPLAPSSDFRHLQALTSLNLSQLKLSHVCNLSALPLLERLVLSFNCLASLPCLAGCPRLAVLNASHNELATLHWDDSQDTVVAELAEHAEPDAGAVGSGPAPSRGS